MKLKKQIFPKTKSLGKRLWGKEDLLVLIPGAGLPDPGIGQ